MKKIFISYRRDDAAAMAGRLYDSLSARFRQSAVFFDVDTIDGGATFDEEIDRCLSETGVLLAVIGDHWFQLLEERAANSGQPDFVAVEILTAAERNVDIVPVLVGKGAMLQFERLCKSDSPLADCLARRQVREVDAGKDYRTHVDRLIRDLEKQLGLRRRRLLRASLVIGLILLACGVGYATSQAIYVARFRQIAEQSVAVGLVSVEDRSDPGQAVPPEVIFREAQREVFLSGMSCYRTFDQHRDVVNEVVREGKDLYVLLMDPDCPDVAGLSERLHKPMNTEIRQVLSIIKNYPGLAQERVHIRLMSRLPTFTAVMIDGNIEQRELTGDLNPSIRVQPLVTHSVQHEGVILVFGSHATGVINGFDFYAEDLRRQWEDAADSEAKVASISASESIPPPE